MKEVFIGECHTTLSNQLYHVHNRIERLFSKPKHVPRVDTRYGTDVQNILAHGPACTNGPLLSHLYVCGTGPRHDSTSACASLPLASSPGFETEFSYPLNWRSCASLAVPGTTIRGWTSHHSPPKNVPHLRNFPLNGTNFTMNSVEYRGVNK